MKRNELIRTANELMAGDKGLLAMDESICTINRRFEKPGIPRTIEYRKAYQELIVTTPGIRDCLNGVILFDETIRQTTKEGLSLVDILEGSGVIPGIKVDEGTVDLAGFPGEKITLGLDTLSERLWEYRGMGIRFAKWRAVITIGDDIPSNGCIHANMHMLARYAALCQEAGIVPIVETEVLMDGDHEIITSYTVTRNVLKTLFEQLADQRVELQGLLLAPNMVIPGLKARKQDSTEDIAKATVLCLLESVPDTVPGITFLSGGQQPEAATSRFNAIFTDHEKRLPWAVSFSYSGAMQQPVLDYWKGKKEKVKGAQQLLYSRMKLNTLARRGMYTPDLEKAYYSL